MGAYNTARNKKTGRAREGPGERNTIMKDFEFNEIRTNDTVGSETENRENAGGISRIPAEHSAKKSGRSFGAKAFVGLCAACVILSGAFGFGGLMLGSRIAGNNTASTAAESAEETSTLSGVRGTLSGLTRVVSPVKTSAEGEEHTYAEVAALVKDSVVEINTEYTTRNSWFQYTTGGAGSGVILSEDGYIITNAHVILDSNQQNPADSVTVRLTDGTEYSAEIVAYDADEDIAVLHIEAKDLKAAQIGDSGKLVVGEELIIVGNPLGELGGTVTNGIVSATEREIQVGGVKMKLIQTNAAVNPGNSGGGMFNMNGQLVGIVNAKSSGMGIEGIGFAIPVNQALNVSEQLLTKGYVSGKPMIGVSLEDVGTSDGGLSIFGFGSGFGSGSSSNVKPGVYVRSLVEGMNDKVLKEGDRIIAVNGEEISSSEDIKAVVSESKVGDKLSFQLYRDNKLMEVKVTVFERLPDSQTAGTDGKKDDSEKDEKTTGKDKDKKNEEEKKTVIGVSLSKVNGNSLTGAKEGVYVAELTEGMNDKVLKVGDRIVAVNGEEVTNTSDVKEAVENAKVGDKLDFEISRDGKLRSVKVTVFEQTEEMAKAEQEKKDGEEAEAPEEEPREEEGFSFGDFGGLSDLFEKFFGQMG